jgi:FkbM family methyltransferase
MKIGHGLLRRLNLMLSFRVRGRRIRVPLLGGVKSGLSGELFLQQILVSVLPALEGAFVDVGANIRQTLAKLKLADPDRSYYGFEPNAACHTYLEKLIEANAWKAVVTFPCGLSDCTAVQRLSMRAARPLDSLGSVLPALIPSARRTLDLHRQKFAVVFSFDAFENLIEERIGFVKIDVEGMELEVLRGMARSLERDQPIVALELLPGAELAGRRAEVVMLFRALDYEVFQILKGAAGHWAGLRVYERAQLDEESESADFLAVLRSRPSIVSNFKLGMLKL